MLVSSCHLQNRTFSSQAMRTRDNSLVEPGNFHTKNSVTSFSFPPTLRLSPNQFVMAIMADNLACQEYIIWVESRLNEGVACEHWTFQLFSLS